MGKFVKKCRKSFKIKVFKGNLLSRLIEIRGFDYGTWWILYKKSKSEDDRGVDDIVPMENLIKNLSKVLSEYEKDIISEYKKKHENNENND